MGVIGKVSCIDGELACRDASRALGAGTEGAESFIDGVGASVTGNSNEAFFFAGFCLVAAVANIELSSLDASSTLAMIELSDIAGR